MKAMILAAGKGERLRPLTDKTPKPLLQVGEYRLIEYLIHTLVEAGIDEIIINHAHLGEQFEPALGDGTQYGVKITYSPEEIGGLETAGGIINALSLLGEQPFLVVNGDIWTDYPLKQLASLTLKQNVLAHLVLVNNPPHHPEGDFSLQHSVMKNGGEDCLTYSGIGLYHPDFFADQPVSRLPLRPLLNAAMAKQQVHGEAYSGKWFDIGTVERLEELATQLDQTNK